MKMLTLMKIGLAVIVFAVATFGQVDLVKSSPTISTSGKAEIFVDPDVVSMSVRISKVNKDIEVARKEVDAVVAEVWKVMDRNQIDRGDVGISRVKFGRKYQFVSTKDRRIFDADGDEVGERKFVGFEVSTEMGVRIDALDKFESVYLGLLRSGADDVRNVTFETTKLREYKDRARTMAIVAAKEKASAMAKAIGQSVGNAIKIEEERMRTNYGSLSSNNNLSFESISESTASFKADKISVSASVEAVFVLK